MEYGGQIYTSAPQTTPGINGFFGGGLYDSIELQYLGSGMWNALGGHVDLLSYR